jgi:hypothetical protein
MIRAIRSMPAPGATPRSIREIVDWAMPAAAASRSWLSPASSRVRRTSSPMARSIWWTEDSLTRRAYGMSQVKHTPLYAHSSRPAHPTGRGAKGRTSEDENRIERADPIPGGNGSCPESDGYPDPSSASHASGAWADRGWTAPGVRWAGHGRARGTIGHGAWSGTVRSRARGHGPGRRTRPEGGQGPGCAAPGADAARMSAGPRRSRHHRYNPREPRSQTR